METVIIHFWWIESSKEKHLFEIEFINAWIEHSLTEIMYCLKLLVIDVILITRDPRLLIPNLTRVRGTRRSFRPGPTRVSGSKWTREDLYYELTCSVPLGWSEMHTECVPEPDGPGSPCNRNTKFRVNTAQIKANHLNSSILFLKYPEMSKGYCTANTLLTHYKTGIFT